LNFKPWVVKVIALKLRKVGNSVGAILPQEILARMHVTDGDTIFLTEAPGGYRLTPYDPDFEQQMTRARRIMKKRRNVLRELAN
jgi:putative addiction module antidote